MTKRSTRGFLAIMLGLIISNSQAAQGWYGGIGFGNTSYSSEDLDDAVSDLQALNGNLNSVPGITASLTLDDEDSGFKIFFGNNVSDNLAYEFGYADLGEISLDYSLIDDGSFTLDPSTTRISETDSLSGFYGALIGRLPLSSSVSVNGRLGFYSWTVDYDLSILDTTGFLPTGSDSDSDSGSDLFYGVGLDIAWFGLFYEVYDIDGDDVDFVGVSASFGF